MKNKIIVITGGATGIGFALVKELIKNNTVISIDRNLTKIAALKTALPKVESLKADVISSEELNEVISKIEKTHGKIDVLINNAGKGEGFDFVNTPEKELMEKIETEMSINYFAPISLTKKALPLLQKSTEPIVIIISSGLAYMPMSFIGTYCASKAAIHFAAMSIRLQLAKLKIRVVEVLPPVVETDMSKNVTVVKKMPADTFAKIVIEKLTKGEDIMNIGQTAGLEKISRFFPKAAFKMVNRTSS
jgi:short-subunit dehydrogenase involved in D-alanine esterification of teichoic acids